MTMGLGVGEILLILLLILVFFGSKELPIFLRQLGRLTSRIRYFSNSLRQQLNEISNPLQKGNETLFEDVPELKRKLRTTYIGLRRNIEESKRVEYSNLICDRLFSVPEFKNARAVMLYAEMGSEVITRDLITQLLLREKRVVIPYCCDGTRDMGIAEIKDPCNDIVIATESAPAPRSALRGNFLKSDLDIIVCPAVAFDIYGGRLGRGKGYYDNFLREVKGKKPIIGLAFDCQISNDPLPFDHNDIAVDQLITENRILHCSKAETIISSAQNYSR